MSADRGRAPFDDDQRAAAREDLARLARGWKSPRPEPAEEDPGPQPDGGLAILSLALPRLVVNVVGIAICFAAVVGAIFVSTWIVGDVGLLTVALMFALAIGFGAGGLYVLAGPVARLAARRQRRWLDALPVPFDREAYLRLLDVEYMSATVELVVVPARPLDGAARTLLERAAARACWHNQAHWTADGLVVRGRNLTTSESGGRGGGTYYNNHAIHRWFRKAARRFLVPTARAYELTIVRIAID